jgi:CTP:molybdopterin cytidylyltransferase MocA
LVVTTASGSGLRLGSVILAAGAGTRLGGVAKALLETRDRQSFLATVVATARKVGLVDAIVVVGPPYGDAVAAKAAALGVRVVWNPEPARGMASSIALGFAALDGTACDAAWLWPVDHPDVRADTLQVLIAALAQHAAVRPVVGWRGGHPPLIARRVWPMLAACGDQAGGARAVLAAADMIDLEVNDEGCIRDVDTATDLERDD